jgi:predicted glutamine amidotransferase
MNKALTVLVALLPTTAVQAAQPENPPPNVRFVTMDKQEIPLEYLAHSFFFHHPGSDTLKSLVSEEGLAKIQPELAELQKEMTDLRRLAARARQMCKRLQGAKSGQEFAATFVDAERTQEREMRAHAQRILAMLNANDRAALERYLNTEYRQSFSRVKFDYDAMYASATFPSTQTMSVTQKACDSASEMEARATP